MNLSLDQARAIALGAHGFRQQNRSAPVTWPYLEKAIAQMQLLQLDSVNVLVRSHYLPLFSRLGAYDRKLLDRRTLEATRRHMFECWAHEACLVPMTMHPLMRWRMNRALNGASIYREMNRFAREEKAYLRSVLDFVRKHGPTAVSDMPASGAGTGGWWGWSKGKLAFETLFAQGLLTTASRPNFERIYDLTENVIPAEIHNLPTPPEDETFRALTAQGALAMGIATAKDLRDYYRLPVAEAHQALAELVEDGILEPVTVAGWKHTAYRHKDFKPARKAGGSALLSPFDPLVWHRERAERLFNFHYRIEIYTPAPKRKFGYYVLPFLDGDRFVARVCLKSDRQAGVLRANAAHLEPHTDPTETAEKLAAELHRLSAWLGLKGVKAGAKGNLARALKAAL
jgi:uncharacterized protein YcaQ